MMASLQKELVAQLKKGEVLDIENVDPNRDEEGPALKRDQFNVNRLLDIFALGSNRYRISNIRFHYADTAGSRDKKAGGFERFAEDMASWAGPQKLDERVALFICANMCDCLNFKDVKEFNDKGLWGVRLNFLYQGNFTTSFV